MKVHTNPNWLSTDVQASIDPPSIQKIKLMKDDLEECNIINIRMRCEPEPLLNSGTA